MSFVLITGGVRCGKSAFAEQLAAMQSDSVLYAAFGIVADEEMKLRIDAHKERRPKHWGVWEDTDSLIIPNNIFSGYHVVLVDCLSTWLANRCMQIPESEYKQPFHKECIREEVREWLKCIKQSNQHIIAVSSEVGLGGVAMSPLGRLFQDLLGEVNQLSAEQADEVYAVLSGIPLRLKG